MVRPERFELPTCCSGGNRSIQLSYGRAPIFNSLHGQGKLLQRVRPGIGGQPAQAGKAHPLNRRDFVVDRIQNALRPGRRSEAWIVRELVPLAPPTAIATSTAISAVAASTATTTAKSPAAAAALGFGSRFVNVDGAAAHR